EGHCRAGDAVERRGEGAAAGAADGQRLHLVAGAVADRQHGAERRRHQRQVGVGQGARGGGDEVQNVVRHQGGDRGRGRTEGVGRGGLDVRGRRGRGGAVVGDGGRRHAVERQREGDAVGGAGEEGEQLRLGGDGRPLAVEQRRVGAAAGAAEGDVLHLV